MRADIVNEVKRLACSLLSLTLPVLGALDCDAPPPQPPPEPAAQTVDETPPVAELEPAPPPGPECLPEGFSPAPPSAPSPDSQASDGACWAVPKATAKATKKSVRQDWHLKNERSKLNVDFGCDRLDAIQEITLQYGSGHGGTLNFARLRATPEGDWEVLLLRGSFYYGLPDTVGSFRGRLGAKDVAAALDEARAAMALEVEEILPKNHSSLSSSSSSGDFHAFLRLRDAKDHARSVAFTGYPNSGAQDRWIPARLATVPFIELLDEEATLKKVEIDDDSRTFFMTRFAEAEAARYYGELAAWWVHERLLLMAAEHATPDLVPALGQRLCGEARDVGDARRRDAALRSIFALVGYEEQDKDLLPAKDENEEPSFRAAVFGEWIDACAISCPPPLSDGPS